MWACLVQTTALHLHLEPSVKIGVSAIKVGLCHVTRTLETVCARLDGWVQSARAREKPDVQKTRTVMMTTVCVSTGF